MYEAKTKDKIFYLLLELAGKDTREYDVLRVARYFCTDEDVIASRGNVRIDLHDKKERELTMPK